MLIGIQTQMIENLCLAILLCSVTVPYYGVSINKCIALSNTKAEINDVSTRIQDLLWIKGTANEIVGVKNHIVYEYTQ